MMNDTATSTPTNKSLLNVVLFQPEIPQNTGNIGRLCAFNGLRLHLIHPLGFTLSEKHIRRSGMDYWKTLDLVEHPNWDAFVAQVEEGSNIWLFSTKGSHSHWSGEYKPGDYLLFGNEGHGCPESVHAMVGTQHVLKIPQLVKGPRSLNLSTSVGIAVYEGLNKIKEFVKFDEY